jgi:serine phosphatase RsbU (regulator of sigma subunit)
MLAVPDPLSSVYSLIGPGDVDGVIVATGSMGGDENSPAVQEVFARFGQIPRCSIAYAQPGTPSVCIDNSSGVYQATRHLIERHGRRKLAFLAGHGAESDQRFAGFRRAHVDCGLQFDDALLLAGKYNAESGIAAVAHLGTAAAPRADALVAANDWMAMGVLEEAERQGFGIPEQLSVVGFDDSDQARFTTPPLTTVRQPIGELSREAVRLVVAQISGQPVPPVTHLATELVVRLSCGCVNRALLPESQLVNAHGRILDVLKRYRIPCRHALTEAAPQSSAVLEPDWADDLLNALYADLEQNSGAFYAALDRLLRRTASLGSVTSWHGAIASLRGAAIRTGITDVREWFTLESIMDEAHILIGNHAEQVQGRRRIAKEVQVHAVEALGDAVRTTLDHDGIGRSLAQHMANVGLGNCWVTRLPDAVYPTAPSKLIVACSSSGALDVRGEPVFNAGCILPNAYLKPEPSTYVIQPMVFGGITLGLCILSHDCRDAAVYTQICAPVTAAVKAVQLVETVVAEVREREKLERERLEQEMAIAQRIQTAIFPKDLTVSGLEISASTDPATEVGGDYFDVLPTEDGCWLGIGDVAGHGLPTGLVALMIQSIVAGMTHHGVEAPPAELWHDMNAVLYDNVRARLRQDEHATLTLIRYRTNGHLKFAGAHEDLVVLRAGAEHCVKVPTTGIWAGIVKQASGAALMEGELQLADGDLLLLYTDGITEARNDQRELFGLERLCALLEKHRHLNVEAIHRAMVVEVETWSRRKDDDRTLVVVRYCRQAET